MKRLEREARLQGRDPPAVREQLAELAVAYKAGELTEAERDGLQDELVARLLSASRTDM